MARKEPILFACVYDDYEEDKINFLNVKVLVKSPSVALKNLSTEKVFRDFAEKHKNLMKDVDFSKAWFRKDSNRASGLYWNLSRLIIPVIDSHDYFKVAYYS